MDAGVRATQDAKAEEQLPVKKLVGLISLVLFLLVAVVLGGYVLYLDYVVTSRFEGQRWQVPSRVYARPLELVVDKKLKPEQLEFELKKLNYHPVRQLTKPGQYMRQGSRVFLHKRGFEYGDQVESDQALTIDFADNKIVAITDKASGRDVLSSRLEPLEIGAIYPKQNEDRVLLQLHEAPELLRKGLIAVEDHHFYRHGGIDIIAIARAAFANIEAGEAVQGGSTITQQLVKNFYLSNEKTLRRKLNEAVMAVLLDYHYGKDEILTAYLNEVYLAQAGSRAIHGFGLAAPYLFEKRLSELEPHEIALLVGLVRGPSYYDPRRFTDRALARRNRVLDVWQEQGLITKEQFKKYSARPLGVETNKDNDSNSYPSYLQLVKQQLGREYENEALTSEGYRLYTAFDPQVQHAIETAVKIELNAIEADFQLPKKQLQVAVVATRIGTGEVVGLLGARHETFGGFNRALDAKRPIGSLVKPAVYLAALEKPDTYYLSTMLDDNPLVIDDKKGKVWAPKNYDNEFHDLVPLYEALAHSYNVATVRLGMEVGLDKVVDTLHRLGIEREISPLPSLPLGAIDLSPFDVAQMYQTIASGGYRTPLRALTAVVDKNSQPLSRYQLDVQQTIADESVYLISVALQNVALIGTARSLYPALSESLAIAGKTGTTNELRDSWFAGFTGDYLVVVWLGNDDNTPTSLTGATGAMRVWRRIMQSLDPEPLLLTQPEGITMVNIDVESGKQVGEDCDEGIAMPVVKDFPPPSLDGCGENVGTKVIDWLKQFMPSTE